MEVLYEDILVVVRGAPFIPYRTVALGNLSRSNDLGNSGVPRESFHAQLG